MENITFEQVIKAEEKSLIYKPITKEQSLGKTIKEIKSFRTGGGFMNTRPVSAIIFTDGTALFLNNDHNSITYFNCLTMTSKDSETGEITTFIRSEGEDMIDNGLCDEGLLKDSLKYLKAFRESQRDEDKAREIRDLKERLKSLED